ncbi:DUF1702 family protein [Rugosimonospora acidiphila]|uniref:DUF1702 family protein n=1 Tax=Rugosimonospora acidiphila TaxID=556531 RepID=A0ABP9RL22_9ACTN
MTGTHVNRRLPTPAGWRRVLALKPTMVDFVERGFRTTPAGTRSTLESAAGAFLDGFNAELASPAGQPPDLSPVPAVRRGFAAEGAGMAAALLDALTPAGTRRLARLRAEYDGRYAYLVHVGVGWSMAKLYRHRLPRSTGDAPLLRWLAYDGVGFCQSFFASPRRFARWSAHPSSCPPTCDIQYQGVGRSLWFRACADPDVLGSYVEGMPEAHRGDVWSGIALAATYAGGVEPEALRRLAELTGAHRAAAAQGAAFGAEAWRLSGSVPAHARAAVEALANSTLEEAAAWTWQARRGLDVPGADATHYRRWRLAVQRRATVALTG